MLFLKNTAIRTRVIITASPQTIHARLKNFLRAEEDFFAITKDAIDEIRKSARVRRMGIKT